MPKVVNTIKEVFYQEVNNTLILLFVFNLLWRWFSLLISQDLTYNLCIVVTLSTIVTGLVGSCYNYRFLYNSYTGNFDHTLAFINTILRIWVSGIGRIVGFYLAPEEKEVWYAGLGGFIGGISGEVLFILLGMCFTVCIRYEGNNCQSFPQVLNSISRYTWRNTLEGIFWAAAMQLNLQETSGFFADSLVVALISSVGYLLAVISSVPFWYGFLNCKSRLGIYLPGEEKIDLTNNLSYDTFEEYPPAIFNPMQSQDNILSVVL